MQRGIDKEAAARNEAEFEIGGDWLGPVNVVHDTLPWLRAQIDDLSADGQTLIEIKVPGRKTHEVALRGEIPEYYKIQMDHEMLVSGARRAAYVSWDEDGGCIILWYERDDVRIAALLAAEIEFWNYIQEDTPPPLTLKDFIVRMDDAWSDAATEYRRLKKIADEAAKNADNAHDILVKLANGKSSIGGGVKVVVVPQKGKISYKNVVDELLSIIGEPFDLEPYRSEGTTSTRVYVEQ